MLKQLIIASFALAAVAGAPARAQTADVSSVKVSFDGIDTHSTSGARLMLQRIKVAAEKICGGYPSAPLDRVAKFKPCVDEVTQRTVNGLNNVRLTALYQNHSAPIAGPQTVASAR